MPVLVVVAALSLFGSACSSDDGGSASSSTVDGSVAPDEAGGSETTGDPAGDPSVEPVSDEEFDEQMGSLHANIASAGDDVCALSKALGSLPPDPVNAEQTKQYVDTYVLMLRNIADILGPETEFGAPVADAADKFEARAQELEYSPEFIEDDKLFEIMNARPVSLGLVRFGELAVDCPDATG